MPNIIGYSLVARPSGPVLAEERCGHLPPSAQQTTALLMLCLYARLAVQSHIVMLIRCCVWLDALTSNLFCHSAVGGNANLVAHRIVEKLEAGPADT